MLPLKYNFAKALSVLMLLAVFSPQVNAQGIKPKASTVKPKAPIAKTTAAKPKPGNVVDATTMDNKIMAGYQGWFRNPGDNPKNINQGWSHLFSGNGSGNSVMRPGFDMWPDMSEYAMDEKTPVPGYTNPDGSQAYLYSAQNGKAVMRHFQWMKQYGIDGVWLSQFCDHFPYGKQAYDSTTVYTIMHNVQAGARATGRTWAFMWDMSGFVANRGASLISKEDVYKVIITNWKRMVDEGVTTDPRYLHDHGKPVLLIWGFFSNRPASGPDYMNPILDVLLAPGKYQAYVVAGVDNKWRQGTPEFQAMLMRMQGLQPWSVGRRVTDPKTGYSVPFMDEWDADIAMCKEHNVKFMPVFNSGTNVAGPPPVPPKSPSVPRRTGNYLWAQFIKAAQTGVINSGFVAMFDEINEGTQIMKTANKPPVQYPFLTFDGATNDYYLRLVGTGAKLLKSGKVPDVIPISPFSDAKWYKLQNKASGLQMNNTSKTAKASITQAAGLAGTHQEWQLTYDGNDYFKIKSRLSGKFISGTAEDGPVTQAVDSKSDNLKWHMEWDGTGYCRIINKATGKALSNNAVTTEGTPVMQTVDTPKSDDFRWKVIEE